jgi:uncharacterized protein (TIRG00374 family)
LKPIARSGKNWLKWLPGVLISLVALAILARLANWREVGTALQAFRWPYLVGSTLLSLGFLATRALAWRALLESRVKISQAFWAINQGYLINNLLPLRAGELGRAVLLGQSSGLNPVRILSTIVVERAIDLAFAATLLLSTLPLVSGMAWARPLAWMTLGIILGLLGFLYAVARNQTLANDLLEKIALRLGWRFVQRVVLPQVRSLIAGFGALTNPISLLRAFFWIGASWGLAVSNYYLMLLPIAPHAPFWWGVFADGVLAMGIALPSAPAALGTFEASLVGALALLDVETTPALAYAITLHFLQFLTTGLLAVFGLVGQRRSLEGLLEVLKLREYSH